MTINDVLIVDKQGTPRDWASAQDGACYYARGKVVWGIGSTVKKFTGGKNKDGETSVIEVPAILGVSGPIFSDDWYDRETLYAERYVLYGRDRHLCAYCGEQYKDYQLTIDHVLPKSRGGLNTWVNTVSACKPCNVRKADRTPEEAGMHLLYVPYAPSIFEKMILENRSILVDQMEFLVGRIPKHSRIWIDYKH